MAETGTQELFDEEFLARLQGLHLIAKRLATMSGAGRRRSRMLGDGLEFTDHRAYAAGDDIRFVDWPYFARMEKLLLRLFHQHSESDVAILLDTSASMAPGGRAEVFDYARHVAAALSYVAMGSGQRVILQPFAADIGTSMRSGRDRNKILPLLDFLAEMTPQGETDLSRWMPAFTQSCGDVGTVVMISDFHFRFRYPKLGEQLNDALARLADRNRDVVVLHTYSRADAEPVLSGPVRLRDAETGREVNLQINEPLRESYRRCWGDFRETLESACRTHKVIYVAACTDQPFEQLVLQTLRRAGVLS
jgi:uncharacterized protein (DUF58 family)